MLYFLLIGTVLSYLINIVQLQNQMYLENKGFEVEYQKCTLRINNLKIMEWGIFIFLIFLNNKNVTYCVNIFSYLFVISTYYINVFDYKVKQNILFEMIVFLILQIYLQFNTYNFIEYLMLGLCFATSLIVE